MKLTLKQIEQGISEAIRLRIIANGYLPDVTAYATPELYQTARNAIKTAGKEIIECFIGGSYKSNEELKNNDIIISRYGKDPASTGTLPTLQYEKVEEQPEYTKSKTPEGLFDITYKVTYICYSENYADIIETILHEALGTRRVLNALNDSGVVVAPFNFQYRNYTDLSGQDFIERAYYFEITNIDLLGDTTYPNVPEMGEFTFDPVPADHETIQDVDNFKEN